MQQEHLYTSSNVVKSSEVQLNFAAFDLQKIQFNTVILQNWAACLDPYSLCFSSLLWLFIVIELFALGWDMARKQK